MAYHLQNVWEDMLVVPEGMNLDMLNMGDSRIDLLVDGLREHARDKIVIDLGCGTGLLGLKAIEYGAKKVFFVEQNEQMVHIIRSVLPEKVSVPFKIIHKDIEALTIDDFDGDVPDLHVSEFYGPRLFDEGFVPYVKHLRSLFPSIRSVPERFCVRISIVEEGLGRWPWPQHHPELVDHFRMMYATKGFVGRAGEFFDVIDYDRARLSFDANSLDEVLEVVVDIEQRQAPCMILCEGEIACGGATRNWAAWGWWVDTREAPKSLLLGLRGGVTPFCHSGP